MRREDFGELFAFLGVARERSFTRAAAKLGVSPSALSHTIRALEERFGVRLLTRTTRSVAPTTAGERLLVTLSPHFEGIAAEVDALGALRDKPSGRIRITVSEHAAHAVLLPKLCKFLPRFPDIKVELMIDNGLIDIVEQHYDAGVRFGEQVAKDMIAVRLSPEMRMSVVATPAYFERRPPPRTPKELIAHDCINLYLPTLGGLYAWQFEKGRDRLNVKVEGQLVFNSTQLILEATLAGQGIGFVPEPLAQRYVTGGRLRRVLREWCAPFPGYHLYYPRRRQFSPAFSLLVEALRHRR
jgi:DNA-binding transcriptional LysR family regulator